MQRLIHARITGHLGELLQGRLGPTGPVALITLPAPDLAVRVSYREGPFTLFQPQGRAITPPHLAALLRALDCPLSGRFIIHCPYPVGGGGGASTATRLAIARILRPAWPDALLEQVVRAVEGASDPLLRPAPERVLWASRAARVVQQMPPLPRLRIVGGFDGQPRMTDPQDDHFPDISDLVARWPAACADAAKIAELAMLSATRTAALRGVDIASIAGVARTCGALGFAMAHTGAARALLLAWDSDPTQALALLAARGYSHPLSYVIGA